MRESLRQRQERMVFSATERKKRRSALLAEKRKAKSIKKVFRKNQDQYLRRKAVKKALVKGEAEAYRASIKAFDDLCRELRDTAARLKGARTSYENSLPSVIKLQLEYARGWREGQEQLRRSTNGTNQ